MKVLCPATWQKRKSNGCDSHCTHFLPHERREGSEAISCRAIKNSDGHIVCPACVRATVESTKRATVAAVVHKMTKKFEYEEEEK